MDIDKMLEELRAERESIDEAILTLERLARGHGARRGRPPKWLADMRQEAGSGGSKPPAAKRSAKASPESE